jgi:hypothetical protein
MQIAFSGTNSCKVPTEANTSWDILRVQVTAAKGSPVVPENGIRSNATEPDNAVIRSESIGSEISPLNESPVQSPRTQYFPLSCYLVEVSRYHLDHT